MKNTKNLRGGEIYAAPTIEMIEISIEKGFASSTIEPTSADFLSNYTLTWGADANDELE